MNFYTVYFNFAGESMKYLFQSEASLNIIKETFAKKVTVPHRVLIASKPLTLDEALSLVQHGDI